MWKLEDGQPRVGVCDFGSVTDVASGVAEIDGEDVESIGFTFEIGRRDGSAGAHTIGIPAEQAIPVVNAICVCMAKAGDPIARAIVDRFFTGGAN